MATFDSVSQFKLKRTLEALSRKEGRGTELVSLYVPPDRQIHEVMANLREEYGTATNIKSRTTRKNVQEAIAKVQERLKLFKAPPKNGLVIFCGAIPQNGPGSERMETYVLEPPERIDVYLYRCDAKFITEPLLELTREKEIFGVLVVDINEAVIATLSGRRKEVKKELTSGIGGKTRAGGQSARRYERIREQNINEYFKRLGKHANEIFGQIKDLKGVIIGGPGPTKYDFAEGDYLNYMLKEKIIGTVDTSYVGERGVDEIVEKSQDILRGVRYMEEKRLVQNFLYQVGHDTGLGVYGEVTVRKYLKDGLVDTLLVSDKLNMLHVMTKCKSCSNDEDSLIPPASMAKFEQDLVSMPCKKCGKSTRVVSDKADLADELLDLAEKAGAKVEFISTETEDGIQLLEGFGGIAATLRYRAS